tara:strand:- start:397 stop:696 length:300 start_codon:yes stop_codon:yes gene_type:complete
MFVHTVLFHLKEALSNEEIAAFESGLDSLKGIAANNAIYIGKVADTHSRNFVRSDYDYNLTLLFDDIEAHNTYQVDPLHKAFVAENSKFWVRIEIIDSE